jgi:hypothetical protein
MQSCTVTDTLFSHKIPAENNLFSLLIKIANFAKNPQNFDKKNSLYERQDMSV